MPTLDIIQLDGRDSFVTGVPGLDSVVVEGKVAVFHKNPKLVKTIHRLEIRFCGVTTTKVRPKSLFGTRGKKFKGRWNHVAIPPAVFVGAGAPSLDPLFLKPGEVILFPFSFRIGKHQAAMDMPPSIILPQVGDLRSRGETRYWLEARMGWMRKNNFKASRRVGVEVWMDVLSPSTLSNMLANRPHPTRATHGTESMDRRRSQDSTSTTGSTHRSSMTGLERLRKPSFEDLGVQRRPLSSSSTSDPWNSSEEALIRRKAETAPKLADAAEGIFDRKESTSLDLASTKSLPGDVGHCPAPPSTPPTVPAPNTPPSLSEVSLARSVRRRNPFESDDLALGLIDVRRPPLEWKTEAFSVSIDRFVFSGGDNIRVSFCFNNSSLARNPEGQQGNHPINSLSTSSCHEGKELDTPPTLPPRPSVLSPPSPVLKTKTPLSKALNFFTPKLGRKSRSQGTIEPRESATLDRKESYSTETVGRPSLPISTQPLLPPRQGIPSTMNPFQIKGEVPPPKRITVELSIEERVVVRAPCDRDHHDAVLTSNPAFHESAVGLGMLEEGRSSSESDFGSRDDLGNRGDAFFERLAEGPLYISEDKAIGSSSSGYGEPGGGKVVGRRKLVRVPTPPHLVGVQTKTSIRGRTRLLKAGGDTERWVKSLETRKEVATWKWTEEAEGDFSTERACTIIVPPVFSAPDVTSPPEGLIHPYSDDDKDSISNAETTTTIIPSPDYKRKVRQGRPKDQVINNSISQKTLIISKSQSSMRREAGMASGSVPGSSASSVYEKEDDARSDFGTFSRRRWKSGPELRGSEGSLHGQTRPAGVLGFLNKGRSTPSIRGGEDFNRNSIQDRPSTSLSRYKKDHSLADTSIVEGLRPTSQHSIISVEHRFVLRLEGYVDPAFGKLSAATLIAPIVVCPLDLATCRHLAKDFRFSPDDAVFLASHPAHKSRAPSRDHLATGATSGPSSSPPPPHIWSPSSGINVAPLDKTSRPNSPPPPPPVALSQSSSRSTKSNQSDSVYQTPMLVPFVPEKDSDLVTVDYKTPTSMPSVPVRRSSSGALIGQPATFSRSSSPLSRNGDWDAERISDRKPRRPTSFSNGFLEHTAAPAAEGGQREGPRFPQPFKEGMQGIGGNGEGGGPDKALKRLSEERLGF